jgi:uncharacterized protein (TIGR02646 family)
MRTIQKGPEPRSLLEYRKSADACYDGYQDKQDVRDQLVEEQRGLCCYCQSRIRANPVDMKIEHWQSQSPNKYPELQLDYTNMLGACFGGQKNGERSPRERHHCDTLKGDADLCFCLTDRGRPIEKHLRFLGDGRVQSDVVDIQRDIDEVLRLNIAHLQENRKSVLKAFQQRLICGRPLDVSKELPKWDGTQAGDLPEFAQVVVYWLRKRQARSAA